MTSLGLVLIGMKVLFFLINSFPALKCLRFNPKSCSIGFVEYVSAFGYYLNYDFYTQWHDRTSSISGGRRDKFLNFSAYWISFTLRVLGLSCKVSNLVISFLVNFAGPGVDGDYGPYRQSERNSLYKQYAEKLLESGYVYRCFCSSEVILFCIWVFKHVFACQIIRLENENILVIDLQMEILREYEWLDDLPFCLVDVYALFSWLKECQIVVHTFLAYSERKLDENLLRIFGFLRHHKSCYLFILCSY